MQKYAMPVGDNLDFIADGYFNFLESSIEPRSGGLEKSEVFRRFGSAEMLEEYGEVLSWHLMRLRCRAFFRKQWAEALVAVGLAEDE